MRGFLRRPLEVASIVPSSAALEERLSALDCLKKARTVVELGPGTGGTTRALLRAMNSSSRLLCVEISPLFVEDLKRLPDARLDVYCGDAADLRAILNARGYPAPDVIVSGIPFSTLPKRTGERIVKEIHASLAEGGTFVAYQLSDRIRSLADPLFGRSETSYVVRNFPPLRVSCWTKPSEQPSMATSREASMRSA